MDLDKIIAELRAERQRIMEAILSLEQEASEPRASARATRRTTHGQKTCRAASNKKNPPRASSGPTALG